MIKDTRFRDKLNFRQLGGYVTTDGRSVKENVFYRSGAPFRMNESEIEVLKELGLAAIMDLRSNEEILQRPDPEFPNILMIKHSGTVSEGGEEINFSSEGMNRIGEGGKEQLALLKKYYARMPFNNQAFRILFEHIQKGDVPILIHCASGKDRTGVACMLILLALGVDIVVESATKFINGHSDVVAGVVATNNEDYYKQLVLFRKNFGGILGVQDAWLIMRGMKTMGLRMKQSSENAQAIAEFLYNHPKIKHVYYPGLDSHPGHDIHMSQAKCGGAVLSFSLASKDDLMSFTRKVKIPILAVSLGGVESILSHPATMSHACLSVEERLEQGVTDELLRLSCGIEDITDLLEDFKQALE